MVLSRERYTSRAGGASRRTSSKRQVDFEGNGRLLELDYLFPCNKREAIEELREIEAIEKEEMGGGDK